MKLKITRRLALLTEAQAARLHAKMLSDAETVARAAAQAQVLQTYQARLADSWRGSGVTGRLLAARAELFRAAAAAAERQIGQAAAQAQAAREAGLGEYATLKHRARMLREKSHAAVAQAAGAAEAAAARDADRSPRSRKSFT